jgi:hypothetical protein
MNGCQHVYDNTPSPPTQLPRPLSSMAICTVFLIPHPRGGRTPPCHLPTSYITSRASVGECASPLATPAKVLPTLIIAREQGLVIKGAESCERRWGNQPGNLPVGVAPVGLVGVVAKASVDSMGELRNI